MEDIPACSRLADIARCPGQGLTRDFHGREEWLKCTTMMEVATMMEVVGEQRVPDGWVKVTGVAVMAREELG